MNMGVMGKHTRLFDEAIPIYGPLLAKATDSAWRRSTPDVGMRIFTPIRWLANRTMLGDQPWQANQFEGSA